MVLLASTYDQSRFVKAADLEREKKFRIKSVTEEPVGAEQKEKKLVVWFTNDERGLVLNKTNNRASTADRARAMVRVAARGRLARLP